MHYSIFREYDIRGKVDSELVLADIPQLTRAILGYFVHRKPLLKTIVVARDGRTSSPAIEEALVDTILECGFDVVRIGICPSPVLYYALHTEPVDAGLMITASHNPKEYNGIKILLGTESVWGSQIQEIYQLYREKRSVPSVNIRGTLTERDMIASYIGMLYTSFPSLVNFDLPFVIDSGNGAGGTVIPRLCERMEWKNVQLLCQEVDGTYPNHVADPTVAKNMHDVKEALETSKALLGFGLDGDADRMGAMTKEGILIPGDQLLALFAQEIIAHRPGAHVVFDVKCSQGLIELLVEWNAGYSMSPCGHAIIKERMRQTNALLGGELSCHFFFADHYYGYDDGIYAMMRLLQILHRRNESLTRLLQVFPKKVSSHELRIPCSDTQKKDIVASVKKSFEQRTDLSITTIDGIRVAFPYGWASIRVSNTQPVLSIRFEGNSRDDFNRVKNELLTALAPYFDKEALAELAYE